MLQKIKTYVARQKLRKYNQGIKEAELKPLKSIRNVGLIFNVEKMTWKEVSKVIQFFEERGKSVITLGYFNEKELTSNYNPNYKHMFFCKRELNFWNLPVVSGIGQFTGTGFDYLINLDVEGELVLQAVSAFSKASTRIGLYIEEYEFCQDFMIKTNVQNGLELFDEIKKYLK